MLYNYLADNFTPERAEWLVRCITLVESFGVDGLDDKLEEIAFYRDDLDTAGRRDEINITVLGELTLLLSMHDIEVLDLTTDLILIHDMTATIKRVSEEYSANYILERIDLNLTEANEPIDVFSSLVELVTDSSADKVFDSIYSMEPDIIINLKSLLDDMKQKEIPMDGVMDAVERYKVYLKGRRSGLIYEAVSGSIKIGELPFDNLYILLEEHLDDLPKDEILFELISLMLVSNTETEDLPELFAKVSRLMGETEASGKLILADLKKDYTSTTGLSL